MEFRRHFGYDVEAASNEAAIPAGQHGESMTVQSMAEEADINVILRRVGIGGQVPQNFRLPQYGDYEGISDFQSALGAVMEASGQFMQLPASVRAQFQNDPQVFLDFTVNPANIDALRKMGLAKESESGRAGKPVAVDERGGQSGAAGSEGRGAAAGAEGAGAVK